MTEIHPTAIVDPDAKVGDGVVIGPYCVVEAGVTLGNNVQLHSHVVVGGWTIVGAKTEIYPFSARGLPPRISNIPEKTQSLSSASAIGFASMSP